MEHRNRITDMAAGLVAGILLMAALGAGDRSQTGEETSSPPVYQVIRAPHAQTLEEDLNALAQDGWRVVSGYQDGAILVRE